MGQRLAVEQMLSRSASAAPAGASNAAPPQLSRTPPIQSTIAAEPWRVARGAAQAASSKRVESEKSSLLRQRQQEAVKKVFEARRKAQAAAVAASFDREKDRTRHAAKNMLHAPCCLPRLPGSTWSRHGCRRAARAARQCRSCVRSCGQRGGARSSPGGPPPWRAPSLQTRGSSLGSSSPLDSWAHQARTGDR